MVGKSSCSVLAASISAMVATVVWGSTVASWNVDANGNWNTASNWSPATVPLSSGDTVMLGDAITASRTITLDTNATISGLTLNCTTVTGTYFFNAGYNFQLNNMLSFDPGTTISVATTDKTGLAITGGAGKFQVDGTLTLQLSGNNNATNLTGLSFRSANILSGSGTIIKKGGNQLVFDGTPPGGSFTGVLRIEEGTLAMNGGSSNGLLNSSATLQVTNGNATHDVSLWGDNTPMLFTVANAVVLDQTYATRDFSLFAFAKRTDIAYSGNISSTSALSNNVRLGKINTGQQYAPIITLSGNNSGLAFASGYGFNANYTLVIVNSDNALGTGNSVSIFWGDNNTYSPINGILANKETTIAGSISMVNTTNGGNKNPVVLIGSKIASGTVNYTGAITLNAIPTFSNGKTSSTGTPSPVDNAYQFQATGTSLVNFNGVIGNAASQGIHAWVIKTGTGTAAFNNANTYLGPTAVRSGTLTINNTNSLGSSSNNTMVRLGDYTTKLADVKAALVNELVSFTFTASTGTITGAPTTVDGVTLQTGDRVLVANNASYQGLTACNGIYTVQSSGTWVRADDMKSNVITLYGAYGYQVKVTNGTNYGSQTFCQISSLPLRINETVNAWAPDTQNPDVALIAAAPLTLGRDIEVVANQSTGISTLGSTSTTGSVIFSGTISLEKNLTVTATTGGDVSFTKQIVGAGFGLTKTGNGKVILANNSSMNYAGATTITQGVLEVDTTLASSGLTVASGAMLQGTGSLTNSVIVNGILAPGNGIGSIMVGSASFGSGGQLAIELNSATSDTLQVTGNLDLNNAILTLSGLTNGSTYTIATFGSITGQFSQINGLPHGYAIRYNDQNITLAPIPEPASVSLLLLGGSMLTVRPKQAR